MIAGNDFHVLQALKELHLSQSRKLAPQTSFSIPEIIRADGNQLNMRSALGAVHSLQQTGYVLECVGGYALTDAGKKAKTHLLLAQAA
jgi:hypothetical protein